MSGLLRRVLVLSFVLAGLSRMAGAQEPVVVASKSFTESVILGEIAAHLVREAEHPARHRRELGGTQFVWQALLRGEVDVYIDYTGTLREEIFAGRSLDEAGLETALEREGVRLSRPLGFNNTYAIGMQESVAARLDLRTISDLARHPDLIFGFSNEFMARADGWPSLRDRYGFTHTEVQGLDHDLAYRGLERDDVQVIDAYSTDAEIAYYGLRILEDDLGHFPRYDAVLVYRDDLDPAAARSLLRLEGAVPSEAMMAMNARAKLDGVAETVVAADFVAERFGVTAHVAVDSWVRRIAGRTAEHLFLVGVSLTAAILVAVPLGIAAALHTGLGRMVLSAVGVVQTIPSLALLVFMIPLLGIGAMPAIAALFLYSLLPIVRNTHAGLTGIGDDLKESAEALGLSRGARLRLIELPLASSHILAGVKVSAVINVGTATLGALIGAGGFGQPILTGIRLDDVGLILEGAVPAAVLALLVQGLFDLSELAVVPRGLRITR